MPGKHRHPVHDPFHDGCGPAVTLSNWAAGRPGRSRAQRRRPAHLHGAGHDAWRSVSWRRSRATSRDRASTVCPPTPPARPPGPAAPSRAPARLPASRSVWPDFDAGSDDSTSASSSAKASLAQSGSMSVSPGRRADGCGCSHRGAASRDLKPTAWPPEARESHDANLNWTSSGMGTESATGRSESLSTVCRPSQQW